MQVLRHSQLLPFDESDSKILVREFDLAWFGRLTFAVLFDFSSSSCNKVQLVAIFKQLAPDQLTCVHLLLLVRVDSIRIERH